ncbi:hypothetical protein D3C81_1926810 [compost metagenome]
MLFWITNWSPDAGVPPPRAKVTPAAVALPPETVPDETGLLSAVTGAAYRSKLVALVNLRIAPPAGKALV